MRERTKQVPVTILADDLNKLLDGWALAIGRFLVAFTSCEYWTYLYIRTFGSAQLRKAILHFDLKPRSLIAHALVSQIGLIEPVQRRVDVAFHKLGQLASKRNLVAHNGPMVQVYRNEQSGEIDVRHELRSARDPAKEMTIPELERLHAEARALDEEFALLYGLVRKRENQVKRYRAEREPRHFRRGDKGISGKRLTNRRTGIQQER